MAGTCCAPTRKLIFPIAVILGLSAGYFGNDLVFTGAETISNIFVNLLKLVSLPIAFLSIVSTISGMQGLDELKSLGKKVVKYTLLTTVLAAAVALFLFLVIDPVNSSLSHMPTVSESSLLKDAKSTTTDGYLKHLIEMVPSNFIQPFVEGNVISVLLLAILLSFAILSLPSDKRQTLHHFFASFYAAIMKITTWLVKLMPIAIFAFVTLFVRELNAGLELQHIGFYLACIVLANLIQAFIILPALLKFKGISPLKAAKAMAPALNLAFWSKSSSATLPVAIDCAEKRLNLSPAVSNFSLPLCTTINMNGCAAFILITVLFVSMTHGMAYSTPELIMWIFIATIAAVGNAGVPMGCFFLSSALLAAMDVPLYLLGIILPFYSLIDMLETSINVWSDSCVTAIVDKEIKEEEVAAAATSIASASLMPEKAD